MILPQCTWRRHFNFSPALAIRVWKNTILFTAGSVFYLLCKEVVHWLEECQIFLNDFRLYLAPKPKTVPHSVFQSADNGLTAPIERSSSRIVKIGHFLDNNDKRIPFKIIFFTVCCFLHVPRICRHNHNDVVVQDPGGSFGVLLHLYPQREDEDLEQVWCATRGV